FTYGMAKIGFGGLLQLTQDHRRDLRWRVLLAVDVNFDQVVRPADDLIWDKLFFALYLVVAAAHEPFDRVHRPPRVRNRLALGRVADKSVSLIGERHNTGREPISFLIRNYFGLASLHNAHHGVRRAEV